jgi:hypothetical protein
MLAPVASGAETVPLPADPSQRATEILASRPVPPARRRTRRRLTAALALVAAAVAGLAAAVALNSGGNSPRTGSTPHAVAPPAPGVNVSEQARNLVSWLRAHRG